MTTPMLLTVASAAVELGCHAETVRRAIRDGKLGCYRLGGCTRISYEQLAAYLESSICPAIDPSARFSKSDAESGTSPGSIEIAVGKFQQKQQIRRALASS